MRGIVALHGNRKGPDWSSRVQKKKRARAKRYCFMCHRDISLKNGNAIYCGSDRKKTGCSYKAKELAGKRWKKKVKYWTYPNIVEKNKIHARKYYLKSKLSE